MGELLSIGEAAEVVGVATSALRHYDEIGLAVPATRVSGQRRYTEEDLTRLRVINQCRRAGFTLDEIASLLDAGAGWQSLARRKREELEGRIDQLVRATRLIDAALACGCANLEGCDAANRHQADDHLPPPEALTDPTRSLLPVDQHR